MNILIVTPIFPPRVGGPATYVWDLASRLKKKHSVTIICFSQNPEEFPGIMLIGVSPAGGMLKRQVRLLIELLKNVKNTDIVYIQGPLVIGLSSAIAAKLLGKRALLKFVGDEAWENARIAGTIDSNLEDFFGRSNPAYLEFQRLAQKIALQLADKIITPSKYLKSFLTEQYQLPRKKITVIPNAVEVKTQAQKKDPTKLVFVGRMVPWKNIDAIIKAVELARKKEKWTLTIIGEGPEEKKLKKMVKKLKAGKWVHFAGRLSKEDTLRHIAMAKKLILYSAYEGLSHTIIEAMFLGTEVIASDIEANRETTEGHATLVPLADLRRLADAINARQADVEEARHFAADRYTWQRHLEQLEKIL